MVRGGLLNETWPFPSAAHSLAEETRVTNKKQPGSHEVWSAEGLSLAGDGENEEEEKEEDHALEFRATPLLMSVRLFKHVIS